MRLFASLAVKKAIIMTENEIGKKIINCAYQVHKELGPGLFESTYETCLLYELTKAGLKTESQKTIAIVYKDVKIDAGYRIDIHVENKVIIELKSVKELNDVYLAQIIAYLKLSENKLGYLINFNVKYFKEGVKRVVNNL